METYKLPLYACIIIALFVFIIRRLRISTRIVTYLTIVIFGYIWSGLLKFDGKISDIKDLLPYLGIMFLLSLLTLINDLWIKKDDY